MSSAAEKITFGRTNKLAREWFWIFAIFAFCFVSRLPFLLNPFQYFDSDEAVLGIMAVRAAQFKELPFYFLGQGYGFSWIETIAAALFIKILGPGAFSLKLAMLVLWSVGCCLYYRSIAFLTNKVYAFMMMAMFIVSPAWLVWSMKARGGYVTAFLLSAIIIFLVVCRENFIGGKAWLCLGTLSGLVFFSYPSFVPVVAVFILFMLLKQKSWKDFLVFLAGTASVTALAKMMFFLQKNTDYHNPAIWGISNDYSLGSLITWLWQVLLQENVDTASGLILLLWLVFFAACFLIHTISFLKKEKRLIFASLLLLSFALIVIMKFFLKEDIYLEKYRYFLPVGVVLSLWAAVIFFEFYKKYFFLRVILVLLFIVFVFLRLYQNTQYSYINTKAQNWHAEEKAIAGLIEDLRKLKIRHGYCTGNCKRIFYKLSFLSGEQILLKRKQRGRIPENGVEVDFAFKNGFPVALLGRVRDHEFRQVRKELAGCSIIQGNYFVCPFLEDKDILIKLGFFPRTPCAYREVVD